MTIQELESRLEEIRSRREELNKEFDGKLFSKEAKEEWEGLDEEERSKETLVKELRFREQVIEERQGNPRNRESGAEFHTRSPGTVRDEDIWDLSGVRGDVNDPETMAHELRERGKRAIEQSRFAHPGITNEEGQERLSASVEALDGTEADFSLHLLRTGSPAYKRAFTRAINKQPLSNAELRTVSLTGEKGGFLLPYELDPTVTLVSNGVVNPIRGLATVKQTTENVFKSVTSGGMSARFREEEGQEAADNSPTFKQPEIECHAADAYAEWTFEFGQDYGSIAGELAMMVGEAKDELEATKLATGSGTKEPFGVLTGAEEVVETATAETFAPRADLTALVEALPPRWQAQASWLGHANIYHLITQAESEGGGPLWQTLNSLQAGVGNTKDGRVPRPLLEYPAYRLSTMQATVVKEKAVMAFGDFSKYWIADRIGMFAKPIDNIPGENGRPTGKEGLYFFWREGAKVLSKAPFRKLVVKHS